MNIWDVLKIEQTKDKDALKKAYRMRLSSVNPEDDQQGFMDLRKAYEEALRLADIEDCEPAQADTPEAQLQQKLETIYTHFSMRINPDIWLELFNSDYFVSLDTSEDAFYGLLRFLMMHALLPSKIWRLIVSHFDMKERRNELKEIFPDNYITFIFNNATYDDVINYDAFVGVNEENEDQIDNFLRAYIDADRSVRNHELEDAKSKLEEIKAEYPFTNYYIPLEDMQISVQTMQKKFVDKCKAELPEKEFTAEVYELIFKQEHAKELTEIYEQAKELLTHCPEDIMLLHFCGDLCMLMLNYEEAARYYNETKRLQPENHNVRAKQAEYALKTERYKEARDMYLELLKENHYNESFRIGVIQANQCMIEENLAHLEEEPDDIATQMEIAWSYYQSYQFQEAVIFLIGIVPDEERKFEYFNVLGRCYLGLQNYEEALQCFQIWKQLIEELPADAVDEETEKKRVRYSYVNFLIADCYMKTKDYQKAEIHLQTALATEHEEIILSLEADCELKYLMGQYIACLHACEKLLERDANDYVAYLYKAKACKELKYIQESYRACEQAITLYPYLAQPYAVEASLLIETQQYIQAEEVLNRYDALASKPESNLINYYRARLYMLNDMIDKAISILKHVTSPECQNTDDMERPEDAYMMLGLCYRYQSEHNLALEAFLQTKKRCPDYPMIDMYIGASYAKNGEIDKALAHLDAQLEKKKSAQAYNERATVYSMIGNFKLALRDFQAALHIDPNNFFAYIRIGMIQELRRNFRAAADAYQNAYDLAKADEAQCKECLQLLMRVYQCMNWFNESRRLYLIYQEKYGFHADIAYDYAVLLTRMGDTEAAISVLKEYIQDSACARKLIQIYGESGYVDLAHETFEYVIRQYPEHKTDHRIYGTMADVFRKQGLYEDAVTLYEQAIILDEKKSENYDSEWMECMLSLKRLRATKKNQPETNISPEQQTPHQYIKCARLARLFKNYKKCQSLLEQGQQIHRCHGCFYSVCHRILYEKAVMYEKMHKYAMARTMYEEAIRVCGQNAYYAACLKRIQDKK